MLTIKFKAIFMEFLNVVDISFNLPTSSINSERSLDNLSIIPVVTQLFLPDKVPLTYRQVSMIK